MLANCLYVSVKIKTIKVGWHQEPQVTHMTQNLAKMTQNSKFLVIRTRLARVA